MPSLSAYYVIGVSLTLDVGYLLTAAPAKCSCCSLLWMWAISSWLPLLTLDMGYLFMATAPDLGCGVSPLGYLLLACFYLNLVSLHFYQKSWSEDD